ncbi:11548_t:CDS:2 [Funneliformis caledonium]|uniref:11548_t:CDS:1 n=1 Tax=Funneliformis caledonium TaxID=1117310 RepID=A0A9N9FI34_9GLOM|nr:11548_t:CDS:2 [Funneliformis caledonium]
MDASQARGTTVLPIARVKRIIKLDEEITTIGTDSTFLIAIAAELFVDYFVKKGVEQAKSDRRKVIQYEDMANLVKNNENLEFLQDIVPETQAFEDFLKNRNRRKRKRKAKDENGSGEENEDEDSDEEDDEDSEDENSEDHEENGDNSSDLEDSPSNVGGVSETDTINENDSDVSEDNDENDSEEETENESEVENGLNENSEVENSINGRGKCINHQKRNGKNVVNVIINNGVSSGSELSDAPETSSDNSTVLNDENE